MAKRPNTVSYNRKPRFSLGRLLTRIVPLTAVVVCLGLPAEVPARPGGGGFAGAGGGARPGGGLTDYRGVHLVAQPPGVARERNRDDDSTGSDLVTGLLEHLHITRVIEDLLAPTEPSSPPVD